MKAFKNYVVCLAGLLLCSFSLALAGESDAVYLNMVREYRLHEDGTVTYRHSHQQELLTYFAFSSRYGETFIVYDTLYQAFKGDIKSVTTMADGRRVPSPDNAFNLVLPRFAANAPAYNHLREMVVTHTGLERNATIELDYTLESKPGFFTHLMNDVILTEHSPINQLTVRVVVPAGKNLPYRLLNSSVAVQEKQDEGLNIYEWSFQNLPAWPNEGAAVSAGYAMPRLLFSTAANLDEVFAGLVSAASPSSSLPGTMQNLLDEYHQEGLTALPLILKLQQVVARDLATFPVPQASVGFRSRPPAEVWNSNGGTPLEKSFLLSQWLSMAGFSAYPVLVSVDPFDTEYPPVLQAFQESLVRVDWQEKKFFLAVDKTSETDEAFQQAGRFAVIIKPSGFETFAFPGFGSDVNQTVFDCAASISTDGQIRARIKGSFGGTLNPYWSVRQGTVSAEQFLSSVFGKAKSKQSSWTRLDWDACAVEGDLEWNDAMQKRGDYWFWELPGTNHALQALKLPGLAKDRQTPLQLPFALSQENVYTLMMHDGWQWVGQEMEVKKVNGIGSLLISIKRKGDTLQIKRYINLIKPVIDVDAYADFLELWQEWEKDKHKVIVLKKQG